MGNPRAFLTIHRQEAGYRPVEDRIDDFSEVEQTLNSSDRRRQASRCMDCGVPFCHWACPLGNKQPEPVTIRENEVAIIEAAFREGFVQPVTPYVTVNASPS